MRHALATLLWASGGRYSDVNEHTWVVSRGFPRGPWEYGKELSWPRGLWHHMHPVAGARRSLGCWAQLRDGCWVQVWEAALSGCWSRAVPPRIHFSPLRGCLGQVTFQHPAVRFCGLVKGFSVPCWKHYAGLRGHGCLEAFPIPLASSPAASKHPDEPGCTRQGQSPELFSLNETTSSLT